MKKISLIVLLIILILVLTSCGGIRKDDFFSNKELNSLYLNNFPKIKYSSSFLKTYVGSIKGYFNVKKDDFIEYSEGVLDYLKNSDYVYGGIIPGTRNSLAGAFPSYNWTTFDHVSLYENNKDSLLYIYKPNGVDHEYCINIEYGSFKQKNNSYNVYIKIKSTNIARFYIPKDSYKELELTKEYIEKNDLLRINYKNYSFDDGDHEFLYVSLDLDIIVGKIDIDVEIIYYGNKDNVKLKCYQESSDLIIDLSRYYKVIKPYIDGDLEIIDYKINQGIIVIENK